MLEHVVAFFCCRHQKFQSFANLGLSRKLAEHRRPQRDFQSGIRFWRFNVLHLGKNWIALNEILRTTRFWIENLKDAALKRALTRNPDLPLNASSVQPFNERRLKRSFSLRPAPFRAAAKCSLP